MPKYSFKTPEPEYCTSCGAPMKLVKIVTKYDTNPDREVIVFTRFMCFKSRWYNFLFHDIIDVPHPNNSDTW